MFAYLEMVKIVFLYDRGPYSCNWICSMFFPILFRNCYIDSVPDIEGHPLGEGTQIQKANQNYQKQ